MTALVVLAHPCDDSFIHSAAARAVTGLQAAGHAVTLIDLYADGFNAVLSREEHRAYLSEALALHLRWR